MSNERIDPRLLALTTLVQIEAEARRAESLNDLCYIVVNDTKRLVNYRQAFLFTDSPAGPSRLTHGSNISQIDQDAPLVRWLCSFSEKVVPATLEETGWLSKPDEATEQDAEVWRGNLAGHLTVMPISEPSGHRLGFVMLFTDAALSQAERTLISRLFQAYGHAWRALDREQKDQKLKSHLIKHWRKYLLAAALLLMLPVRLYVLAPGQVTPDDPHIVTTPMSGVIDTVHIKSNSFVEAGDLLFSLEDTQLRNELAVSEKALNVVQAEHMKNAQNAMFCSECRGILPELQAVSDREKAKVDWARSQLERATVKADRAGVVVFPGRSELEGRPVAVGEKVMTIANPDKTELTIRIPVDDAISIDQKTKIVFYLNVDPLKSFDAEIYQSSYEAMPQPDGTLAYIVKARFTDDSPRLGLRGTAKVYGARSPLLFHILRRPLSWLRRSLGI